MLKGLYGITDIRQTPYDVVLEMVERALQGGMKILQLRDKESDDAALEPMALNLKALCESYGALFIIDDRVELVKKTGVHGLHIGKDDLALQEARKILPDRIIGVSCYGDVNHAKAMESAGADYVAFGSFFPSPTKPHSNVVPLETISLAKQNLSIPVCAIGGITSENYLPLVEMGVDMIAVIHDLWKNGNIDTNIQGYSRFILGEEAADAMSV